MTLANLTSSELLVYREACDRLIKHYQGHGFPLESCPLCPIEKSINLRMKVHSECKGCLWMIIEGESCKEFSLGISTGCIHNISAVRMRPDLYPVGAKRRINSLINWIALINVELRKQ